MMGYLEENLLIKMTKKIRMLMLLSCLFTFLVSGLVCSGSAEVTAKFSAVPTSGSAPLDVSFIDLSVGNVTGWNWTFGDGNTLNYTYIMPNNSTSLFHQYHKPGLYNVTLFAYNATNPMENSTVALVNCVNVTPLSLFANFTATTVRGVAPLNVQFIDTSLGSPVAWTWFFGDGTTINEQGPDHIYKKPGVYNVSLTVYNSTMGSNMTIQNESIVALSQAVTAQMTFVYADPQNPKKIQFFDKSEGVGINNWTWDFGDNTNVSYLQNPSHEYSSSGRNIVNLWISNGYTNSSTSFELGIR